MQNLFNFPTPTFFKITDLGKVIGAVLVTMFLISGLLLFIFLVWGGIDWISSGGDAGKAQQARDKITQALVGLAIVAVAYALAVIISNWLGLGFLNFPIPTAYS